jgi:hypothetical protein
VPLRVLVNLQVLGENATSTSAMSKTMVLMLGDQGRIGVAAWELIDMHPGPLQSGKRFKAPLPPDSFRCAEPQATSLGNQVQS